MLRIYKTSVDGANAISRSGSFAQAIELTANATAGEAVEMQLHLAPAQTKLTDAIDTDTTEILIDVPVIGPGNPLMIIESEVVLVTAGWWTRALTISRAYSGSPASHAAASACINWYSYYAVTINPSDVEGTDESGWLTLAPDSGGSPGSYVSSLTSAQEADLGQIDYNESVTFWVKATVPASQSAQYKSDLRLVPVGEVFSPAV